jgi:hypothetical protein
LLSIEAAPTAQAEGWHLRPWITVSGKRWWLSFVAKRFGSRAGAVAAHVALAGVSDPAGAMRPAGQGTDRSWPAKFFKKNEFAAEQDMGSRVSVARRA